MIRHTVQGYQRVRDNITGDETLIFKYVINGKASGSVRYKIIYPLGEKISGSFLSAIKTTIGNAMEFLSDDMPGRRLAETLSESDLNIVAAELYNFLEKHYLFSALSKNQLSKTICRESIIITVPHSANIVFVYRGRPRDNAAPVQLRLGGCLDFYGVFCGDVFYFQNSSEMAEFPGADYSVRLSTLEMLKSNMLADIRKALKNKIKGNAVNLPYQRLSEEPQNQIQNRYMNAARSNYINERKLDPEQYLETFPSAEAKTRLFETTSICGYLNDSAGFAAREAERHIRENWEGTLYAIEFHRFVACEMVRLAATGELDELKKVLNAVEGITNPVMFTIRKGCHEFTFKIPRPGFLNGDNYHLPAEFMTKRDRKAFYKKFGRFAVADCTDIIKITCGKKILYEREMTEAERIGRLYDEHRKVDDYEG